MPVVGGHRVLGLGSLALVFLLSIACSTNPIPPTPSAAHPASFDKGYPNKTDDLWTAIEYTIYRTNGTVIAEDPDSGVMTFYYFLPPALRSGNLRNHRIFYQKVANPRGELTKALWETFDDKIREELSNYANGQVLPNGLRERVLGHVNRIIFNVDISTSAPIPLVNKIYVEKQIRSVRDHLALANRRAFEEIFRNEIIPMGTTDAELLRQKIYCTIAITNTVGNRSQLYFTSWLDGNPNISVFDRVFFDGLERTLLEIDTGKENYF